MKLRPTSHELIANMRVFFQLNSPVRSIKNEEPLRAELYSTDQMERFGKVLAEKHKLNTKSAGEYLLKRLTENELILNEVRKLLNDSIKNKKQLAPAGEWLIDNFYLIEEHIRIAKTHFPKNYSENLPQLLDGATKGQTRIYDIVLQLISHSDGRIDLESLSRFIKSYQSINYLKLGELWAIPIMLRLALIENIRRISNGIAINRVDRNLADYWAKELIEKAEHDPKNLLLIVADMARSNPPFVSAFVSELTRQLRGKGSGLALSLNWIEQQLSETGLTSNELINSETQKQAADQISISNSIGSLRLLGSMDWRDFVEANSIVDQILKEDHDGTYFLMDFQTRDRYRHVVENIAKKSKIDEYKVAQIAIQLMQENVKSIADDESKKHVGYFLIGDGVAQTKRLSKMPISATQRLWQVLQKHNFIVYLSSICIITSFISIGILFQSFSETKSTFLLLVVFSFSLICASQFAIAVVNFISTIIVKPHLLPRMDFSINIPKEYKTLVIVPAMLTNTTETESLIEALEIRYLANRNEQLHFGLLTDFMDAAQETIPEDSDLLETAINGIKSLNKKYEREKNDLFFLFHRTRKWNPKENAWMGYERKRGKIADLNDLLRGSTIENFSHIIADQTILPTIKYIITLDADTQLPLDTAWKLVGTMAHPLNKAKYSEKEKRITSGYAILQPRVNVSLPDTTGSLYTRMNGNEPGIDPYTRASSDVYQDLFSEGSFIGKGIYEVDSFIKVLEGKFLDNSILSHDLLEGCYLHSGLVSDVQLFEKYPTTYKADMARYRRWVRGDWQIILWIFPFVHDARKHWHKNPLSGLSRWKIFDNIRRSLFPIALTTLVIIGWVVLPSSLFWTLIVSGFIVIPICISSIWDTLNKPKTVSVLNHIKNSFQSIYENFVKTLFELISTPYEAYRNLSAITLTLWRMLVTRKNMLQWNPFANQMVKQKSTLLSVYFFMWIQPLLACTVFIYLVIYLPFTLFIAGPILLLWLITPFITWVISKPLSKQIAVLTIEQNIFLRKLTRKTWGFFEQFIGITSNWLPPDNFQELPIEIIANRTSPTNIGLSLLANITASNFGYITDSQFMERTTNTISTLKKMERYKGHFFNWYHIETLQSLYPKYISTVDSGNLIGNLLVLKQGLLALPSKKILSSKIYEGLIDTLMVLIDTSKGPDVPLLVSFKAELDAICSENDLDYQKVDTHISQLLIIYSSIFVRLSENIKDESFRWKTLFIEQLKNTKTLLELFTPWLLLKDAPTKFVCFDLLEPNPTLTELLKKGLEIQVQLLLYPKENNTSEEEVWLEIFKPALINSVYLTNKLIIDSIDLVQKCNDLAIVDWDFLYDKSSNLFTIGYNVQEHIADHGSYDLLASEARLCTYIGIAQGKLPEKSWFALGRLLTNVGGSPILLSWSGSMFEYLMPLLIMPSFENTLLDQTYKSAVEWQIRYGKKTGKPWGISESGYNMINVNSEFQYRAFGVPGLGLKRGLEEDSVIAPYATALALMIAPKYACENLQLLHENGFAGKYGFYEAIDYSPSRLQRGKSSSIVYSFMAHHQGMTLLSLAYLLLDKPLQKLFVAEPQFKAIQLLLQERIPKATIFHTHTTDIADIDYVEIVNETRIITTPNTLLPEIQLISNGKYHVMITNAGGGYSRWKNLSITRWREDSTCDNWGSFCYIQDYKTGEFWSNTNQPTGIKGEKYEAVFSQGRAIFQTKNNKIETHTEIVVSPEDDIELRRMQITNNSNIRRTLVLTSYLELVLAPAASELIQPIFSNLFMQTEIHPVQHAIRCTRRPRSANEQSPSMFHLMTVEGKNFEEISYETDRLKFIGRGNTTTNPLAMMNVGQLSGSYGSVLDPIAAIRYRITLNPGEKVTVDMITGVAETDLECMALINKYQDNKPHKDRVFEMAWTHSQVVLRQINASEADAQLYEILAGSILFTNAALRAEPSILKNNHRQQPGLWGYSISGDLPIILLKMEMQENLQLVKQMIQAHHYWRMKGLSVDLVIWNEEHNGYRQVFQNDIESLIPYELKDRPGGIFIRASDQISIEDRILFETVARIILSDNDGLLIDQVKKKQLTKPAIPYIIPLDSYAPLQTSLQLPDDLNFFNGIGGFSTKGDEYIIGINAKLKTPAPWVNVIANPDFGTVISESGSSYTWVENAHELRLTPWNNDPVSDTSGEAYYLRDEDTGQFWSTSLLPTGGDSLYVTHHGFGYSIFKHTEDGIDSEMTVFVDVEIAIKFIVIKIVNKSGRPRKLSATGYIEWVLGDNRVKTAMQINTALDPESGAIFAKNSYNTEFSERVAFFDVDYLVKTFTADRAEFIGRNGTLKNPDAMSRIRLSGKLGYALDPCAAIQVPFDLVDGEEQEIIFRLGVGKNGSNASTIAKQFRGSIAAKDAFEKVKKYWNKTIGAVQVETPDAALNLLTNGWLTYQTLSSRIWGRSGFYQSGGAYGFRDQLQDVLSLLHTAPAIARKQILLCASHQFKEGDVQHWWHPPIGRGVRTRISDDFLWLPYVTSKYILHTGDTGILNETVAFIEGRPLNIEEESYFDLPIISNASASLYEHCVRSIKQGLKFGKHGIPLIGTGDWNDGFDKVGNHGIGESVWMGFFLYEILIQFIETAIKFNDQGFADVCKQQAKQIKENINKHAWDGEWYKRAWFDNGKALGSNENEECKIDSIAQSWSVLSGAGDENRSKTAIQSAYINLVQKDIGIIKLLTPSFDKSDLNPGYIKGYLPGIRENGGQYTHAAIWLIMAYAKLNNNERVWELLQMINPINHGKSLEDIQRYKVEPYVIAADVYSSKQNAGRGGWTWYTGSAGWMNQLILESFLGLHKEGNTLTINPCIPESWDSFKVHYRFINTVYHIVVSKKEMVEAVSLTIDDILQENNVIQLKDDEIVHNIAISIGIKKKSIALIEYADLPEKSNF